MLVHCILYSLRPLCGAGQDSQSCLQSASHCHNDRRSGRRCAALCTPASRHHLSVMRTAHISWVLGHKEGYIPHNNNNNNSILDDMMSFESLPLSLPPTVACWADGWPLSPVGYGQKPQWRHCQRTYRVERGWTLGGQTQKIITLQVMWWEDFCLNFL